MEEILVLLDYEGVEMPTASGMTESSSRTPPTRPLALRREVARPTAARTSSPSRTARRTSGRRDGWLRAARDGVPVAPSLSNVKDSEDISLVSTTALGRVLLLPRLNLEVHERVEDAYLPPGRNKVGA